MRLKYLSLLPVLVLAACGFHLRGSQTTADSAALSSVYVQATGAAGVTAAVVAQLQSTSTAIKENAEGAEYILKLSDEQIDRSVLSVSATTGKVEEYLLTLTVRMAATKPGGETLIADESIRVTRDYPFNADAVLGQASEEQVLREEMLQRAATQILRRLNAVARHQ